MPFKNTRNSRDDKSKKDGAKFSKTDSNRAPKSGSRFADKSKSSSDKPYGSYRPGADGNTSQSDSRNSSDSKNKYSKDRPPRDNASFDRDKKPGYGSKPFGKDTRSSGTDRKESGFNRERKPYGDRAESTGKSSGHDRNENSTNRERKPHGERVESNSNSERKPLNQDRLDRNFNKDDKKTFGDKPREAKSFSSKKFTDREKTPFKGRIKAVEDDLRPTYSTKAENFTRPYEKTFEKRGDQPSQDVIDFGDGNVKLRSRPGNKPIFKKDSEFIRLNRYIANAGICSRRKADELIAAGVVSVNGEVISELGAKVNPATDQIRYNGELLKTEKMVYVLLNKPKDFITTTEDPQERKTVMALVEKASRERIYPVGRLDRNTTGLLLMTNDGDLAEKLSHPRNNISKIYQVELNRNLSQGDFNKIAFGLELEDGFIKPDTVSYVTGGSKNEIGIQIHSGKNRIVRRIFESLGYEVVKLDRVIYANLSKKDLPRGKWRHLDEKEVIQLKHFIK